MPKETMRDVIVFLPGITGSVLSKDGKDLWAISKGAIFRALTSVGKNLSQLILAEDPVDTDDIGDGVTATRLISDAHLIPGFWKIDGYTKIVESIQSAFTVKPGENLFEFPYDWRRGNQVAARKLARLSHEWLTKWQQSSGANDAKLILVGHSMGGLVARYFIECLEGWRVTRMLVTFGTPYRGSLNAVNFLANGLEHKLGPFSVDLSTMLRSFTSVYQLLPIYPCIDSGNGQLERITATNVPNVDSDKAKDALAFHYQIRDAVTQHQQEEDYNKDRYRIHPVAGIFQPTVQSARIAGNGVELIENLGGKDDGGDGTVPRGSATPLEVKAEAGVMFAAERHGSLQNNDPVLVQLKGLLSGLTVDSSKYFALKTSLSVDIDDSYAASEPVVVKARPSEEPVELTADVVNLDDGTTWSQGLTRDSDEWHRTEFNLLPPGVYRVTVRGFSVQSVSDVFAVFDATS